MENSLQFEPSRDVLDSPCGNTGQVTSKLDILARDLDIKNSIIEIFRKQTQSSKRYLETYGKAIGWTKTTTKYKFDQ